MNRVLFLKTWSVAVGAMDALTGLLLILLPELVLKLLGIAPPPPHALIYLSWIGVFVAGTGLSYAMALGRKSRAETVWAFTAMVRILVSVFLTGHLLDGSLSPNWGIVAGCDGLVGVIQVVILRVGWWKEVPK